MSDTGDPFKHEYFDDFERDHPNIFASKLALLEVAITADGTRDIGYTVSVGAGTGSYEAALRRDGLDVDRIIEPSANLAAEARGRGFDVTEALAQDVPFEDASIDTIFYNGSAFGFIDEATLRDLFRAHYRQLKPGGVLALLEVLRASWYGAETPHKEYWRTTDDYRALLEDGGFERFSTWQALRRHLIYQNDAREPVAEGYQEGSYVALVARK